MIQDISMTVRSLLDERETLVKREKQLIHDLERVLPGLGYTLVRVRDNGHRAPARRSMPKRAPKRAPATMPKSAPTSGPNAKPLVCPQCARRFARPLHLGRHLSATHGRRKSDK